VPETQSYLLTTSGPALTSFDAYAQQGGFTGLRQALTTMTPAQVLGELRAAGLRGRGGAGVLTAEKLKLVAQAGFRSAVTTLPGTYQTVGSPYTLHRVRSAYDLP